MKKTKKQTIGKFKQSLEGKQLLKQIKLLCIFGKGDGNTKPVVGDVLDGF